MRRDVEITHCNVSAIAQILFTLGTVGFIARMTTMGDNEIYRLGASFGETLRNADEDEEAMSFSDLDYELDQLREQFGEGSEVEKLFESDHFTDGATFGYFDILPMPKGRGFPPSRVRFPVSLKLAYTSFHPSRSYGFSTGFKYRESHGMYITSSVHISIMGNAAFRANPMANIERKRVEDMPTIETALGRGIPLVDLDKVPAIPLCFVCELGHELRPANIRDSLAQFRVFDHVLDGQALDADRLVLTDQACREFLQEVTATIGYSGVDLGNLFAGFLSVFASLLFLGVPTLSLRQFLFILGEEFGVAYGFTGGENHEVLQAEISAYGLLTGRQTLNVILYQDGDEIAISTVFRNGNGTWFAPFGQGSRPDDIKRLGHLCKDEVACRPNEMRYQHR